MVHMIYSCDKELNELRKMTFHFQDYPHATLLNKKSFWLDFFTRWEANVEFKANLLFSTNLTFDLNLE
jgi:hypothetical protein